MSSDVSSSAITSLGVGSGLNLGTLLDNLQSSEQARLQPLQAKETSYKTQLTAYGQLQSALENVQTAADALGKASLYQGTKFSSDASAFSAQGGDGAVPGQYQVDITQLAQAQSLVADSVASTDDPIGAGGTITLSLADSSGNITQSVDLTLSQDDSTLAGIRDAINGADIGINASIINDGSDTPYRLVLTSQATGTDAQLSVSAVDAAGGGSALSDLLDYDSTTGTGNLQQTVAAQDAELTINGIAITSQSNTVEGAIQGVTLSLSAVTTDPQSLTGTRDTDAVKSAISDFVKAYNQYQNVAAKLTAYNGPDADNGVLFGDSTARSVATRLRDALNTPIAGGTFSGLAQIGVALQKDGNGALFMAIDDDTLDAALANNLNDVATLITGGSEGQGVADVLANTLTQLDGDNGLVQTAADGTQRSIDDVDDRMKQMQNSIDATIERYRQQFVQLDTLMSSLNATQSYLTTQLSQLNNNFNNDNNSN